MERTEQTRRLDYRNGRLAEDPTGLTITWDNHGTQTTECLGLYYRQSPAGFMLRTSLGDVNPGIVWVVA